MKKMLSAILFLLSLNVQAIEVTAPFGFKWGQSQEELKNKHVTLNNCSESNKITSCKTTNPIKGVSFGEEYILIMDEEKGLQKVILISKNITSDISGSDGKALYGKIKRSLIKKYNKPESLEHVGLELYKEYDEFYQCLKYEGCGGWFAYWKIKNGGNAILQLKGIKRGTGYIKLTYESKYWGGIVDSIKEREQASDEDAL